MLKYRPELDGLRAVAIFPIVAFHAGVWWLPGGYVGVDVFFVISGYLITRIILTALAEGSFSVLDFYRRRVLRIVPLLVVVLLSVSTAGYFILLPNEFEQLSRSVLAAALFASNIYFWETAGYFAREAIATPLLHTWSIAVEEQFYLFFPLILVGSTDSMLGDTGGGCSGSSRSLSG